MPGKHVGSLCKRCDTLEAILTVRSEPLCRSCFGKYVHTKIVKRMEAFRTRHAAAGQERMLLLPLSLGISSVSLLHVLSQHLQNQMEKSRRIGFTLHVLYIESPASATYQKDQYLRIQEAYPMHSYSTARLEEFFDKPADLETILSQIATASSLSDVLDTLRTRLIVQHGKSLGCEGILWASNTTSLASTILSSTAKGRGYALPYLINDGPSPYGIPFYYPMRDVLRKELISYADLVEPSLSSLVDKACLVRTQAPPSAKQTTIDVLMSAYFEDVEETYPSIVSNVVRTTGKLNMPKDIDGDERCSLCSLPVSVSKMGIEGWGGHQEQEPAQVHVPAQLCYGCARSFPRELLSVLPSFPVPARA